MISISEGNLLYEEDKILTDINLTIKSGECVVICGESGSGKSSLIRVLNGLIPELYEGNIEGKFNVLNRTLPTNEFHEYVKDIGVVFQNPKTQFFMSDVYSELAFSMENYGWKRQEMRERIQSLSDIFSLTTLWSKSMVELSGGQKQQIAFASACMLPHKLFLLDEPSSNLDEKHIDILTDYLMWLKKNNQTMIIVEHRLYYLLPVVDRFIVMKNGGIVQNMTKQELLSYKDSEISQLGLRSLTRPTLKQTQDTDGDSTENQLECLNLFFQYKNTDTSIEIEKLAFTSQSVTGIVGENGAGKTTLSYLLTGLLKPKKGMITYNGKRQTTKELISKSFLVMQDVNFQLFFESVEKEIKAKAKRLDLFDVVVQTLQLNQLLKRHPQTLSGGEKQRVAIASAVLSGKEIVILDEPTSGLDLKHMIEVSDMIKKLRQFGIILIIVSHDKEFLNLTCDNLVQMEEGKVNQNN